MKPFDPHEEAIRWMQRDIRIFQRELAQATADALDESPITRKQGKAAIIRVQKKITLRTKKLLCQHEFTRSQRTIQGKVVMFYRCSHCLITVSYRQ